MALSQGSWSPTSGMRENWLVQVFKTDESAFQAYSFFDQTINSIAYNGIILNNPTIRESIDIFNSRSRISNLSITLNNSGNEAETLLFGSNYYLNGDVKIFSNLQSGTIANFNNIPQIYFGRLESLTHDDVSVTLSIVAKRPWDNVVIPNQYSSNNNIGPVVYGDYSGNSGINFIDTYTNSNYHPALYESNEEFSDQGGTTNLSNVNAAEYSKKYNKFIPYISADSSTTTSNDIQTFTVPNNYFQQYYEKPTAVSNSNDSGNSVSDLSNVTDGNLSTFATVSNSGTGVISNKTSTFSFTISSTHTISSFVARYKVLTSSGVTDRSTVVSITSGSKTDTNTHASTTNDETVEITAIDQGTTSATVTIKFTHNTLGTESYNFVVRFYEMFVTYSVYGEEQEVVYSATDGLSKSFSSGTATKLHDFHRDVCHRFLGLTDTPVGYSDLDSDRNWEGRAWVLEQIPIKNFLDKLAFQGGFVYTYSAAGVLKYIHVKNTYSSADHALDKNDISNVSIGHTPTSDLITDITVNFNKHPALNVYRSQATATDSTTRSNYNLSNSDGKYTFNLDYLTSGQGADIDVSDDDPNDGFINYYGNLRLQPRVILQSTIVNPAHFDMELGDIVTFSNMIPSKAFNKSFSSRYFMVTALSRSSGKLDAEFLDVTRL